MSLEIAFNNESTGEILRQTWKMGDHSLKLNFPIEQLYFVEAI